HWPDRSTNFFGQLGYQHTENQKAVPIEETLEVMAESLGESNAVFLSAWGGDVARDPPKTGRATFQKRIFPGRTVRNDAPTKAVSAMSVVASPACARIGGRKVKRKTENALQVRLNIVCPDVDDQ